MATIKVAKIKISAALLSFFLWLSIYPLIFGSNKLLIPLQSFFETSMLLIFVEE